MLFTLRLTVLRCLLGKLADELLDCVRRQRANFVVERAQHLLNPRVGNGGIASFAESVERLDRDAEDQSSPRFPPEPAICRSLRHRAADNLQDIGEMGLPSNSTPERERCAIVVQ